MVGQPGNARSRRAKLLRAASVPALILALAAPTAPAFAADPPPPGEDFTIAVLPDTQLYTVSATNESKFEDQVNWIVDNQDELNISWVTQVGDLVESWPNVNHWERASRYMKVLDDAGVPNSVLPGNHDMNIVTGEATTYDTYFPPSRYSGASWNSPEASYGGYLGQNLFGPDPVDRKNKDNFGLLTAGGLDFVLINLEFESPDYTLDWAQKVLDAYPDRRAIISTHGFINTVGNRSNVTVRSDPGINSAVQVWNELIYDNCNIFLVLNGHWHDGDEGEANRTDPNACG
ncbi:MAG: PKD domain-containing protein, partial [Leifsonia flava]